MKNDQLKLYSKLRRSLETEKTRLEERLASINQTLGSEMKNGVSKPGRKRKKMSAAAKAKIAAAQKIRWAKWRKSKET